MLKIKAFFVLMIFWIVVLALGWGLITWLLSFVEV